MAGKKVTGSLGRERAHSTARIASLAFYFAFTHRFFAIFTHYGTWGPFLESPDN